MQLYIVLSLSYSYVPSNVLFLPSTIALSFSTDVVLTLSIKVFPMDWDGTSGKLFSDPLMTQFNEAYIALSSIWSETPRRFMLPFV